MAVIAGLGAVLVPWATVRYRLTFEVETPEGFKTGSGVNMAGFSAEPEMFGARGFHSGVWKGEAVPNGYGLALGYGNSPQSELAIAFYKAVAG